jgi:hypothetical protein
LLSLTSVDGPVSGMLDVPAEVWPWIAVVGLGLFHGLNPAMGWLFAVALGLNRNSQRVVLVSLLPIAIGHAAAIGIVLTVVLVLGFVVDRAVVARLAAVVLIGWALWHAFYGHRQRVRVGMQTGLLGLMLWSFLMASAHGAGLMIVPLLFPICGLGTLGISGTGASAAALAMVGLHTVAMLAAIAIISVAVYNFVGVAFLRRGWINLDLVWIGALLVCGVALLVSFA